MVRKWYRKAIVQWAIVSGIFLLTAAFVNGLLHIKKGDRKNLKENGKPENEDWEQPFIKRLRDEAASTKSCFTEFSFKILMLNAAVLSAILVAIKHYHIATLGTIPCIALTMIVARIGIFKYTSANRQHGYQLHLGRKKWNENEEESDPLKWHNRMRRIPWEEAMRSYRIVQIAIFRSIYVIPENTKVGRFFEKWGLTIFNYFNPHFYRHTKKTKELVKAWEEGEILDSDAEYPWFMPKKLTEWRLSKKDRESISPNYHWFMPKKLAEWRALKKKEKQKKSKRRYSLYYSGGYIKNVTGMLTVVQYLMLIPWGCIILTNLNETGNTIVLWLWISGFLILFLLISLRARIIKKRRKIVENELLSIHSCAIIWEAVVLAHHRAMHLANGEYKHYTEHIVKQAEHAAYRVFSLHRWCDYPEHPVYKDNPKYPKTPVYKNDKGQRIYKEGDIYCPEEVEIPYPFT